MGDTIVKPANHEFTCCGSPMCPAYTPGSYVCDSCGNRGIEYTPILPSSLEDNNKKTVPMIEEKQMEVSSPKTEEEFIPAPQNQLEDPILEMIYEGIPIPKTRSHPMSLRPQPRLNYNEYFGRPRKRRRKL